ncbi:hypothetical protein T4B_11912 [Trichinella pseudospiralis]|uniref:Uncharacterized protein n=1 Tax=Trichinella pseudospiralis TaxID=6337 RepID=A0A0V1GP42_TRIPS|nr:hypothetical protein T4B_11912 [Trichinella pseudospiralis]
MAHARSGLSAWCSFALLWTSGSLIRVYGKFENRYLPSKRPATIPPGEHVSSTTKRFYQKQLKVSGSQGCPNEISWHNKRCRVQPDLEGIVWNENYSKRDNTQVLQYENEQRCGLSL